MYPNVQVINLEKNLGYAGNNNVGIEMALKQWADWVFVLNEDIVLEADCLEKLIEVAECDPKIGILGPLVYHHNEPKVIQSAGGVLGKHWQSIHLGKDEPDRGQFNTPLPVEWISGCAILVKREAIQQAGMLDGSFFIYWEETEWCIRISRAGWKIVNVPQAHIWHKGVQRNYEPKPSFTYYGTRNHLQTLAKHGAPLGAKLYVWMQYLRIVTSWSIKPKWKNRREHRNAMVLGIVHFLQHRSGQMPTR
jgi:GT2 family glycosyltransferase